MWRGRGVWGVNGAGDTAWNKERFSARGVTAPLCHRDVALIGPGVTGLVKRQAGGTGACREFCGKSVLEHGGRIKDCGDADFGVVLQNPRREVTTGASSRTPDNLVRLAGEMLSGSMSLSGAETF